MKCFDLSKQPKEVCENCFVYKTYPKQKDLENIKCWIMNGAYQKGNKEQLHQCIQCNYYKEMNKDCGVSLKDMKEVSLVTVNGVLNNDRSEGLAKVCAQLVENKKFFVILDLNQTDNIYSCGLGTIIRIHQDLAAKGGALYVVKASSYVMNLFESTKLSRFLNIKKKESDAIAALKGGIQSKKEEKEKEQAVEQQAKEEEKKKTLKCWEYWKGQNPKNASSCEECYKKISDSGKACWLVEGAVEGVSFQYVNEECEDCEYYKLHNSES